MDIKKILKYFGIYILTALMLLVTGSFQSCIYAKEKWPKAPNVKAPSAVVMEIGSGAVLYEKNAHKQRYPASITKILTTLLAIENCDLNEEVTFSADAVYKNEGSTSNISRDVGEKMTLEQCLYGVMLFSSNECAYAVAEHVAAQDGGDYSHFIDMMNNRAKEIGCTDTSFHNCNGLPDKKHLTSAYDMALIGKEAYKNDVFRKITGTGKYVIPKTNKHKEETPLVNHHNMLYPFTTRNYLYDYCTGGKTGFTQVAQSTLVTFAEKDGMKLVCVVMKEESPNHYVDTKNLLDYGFNSFNAVNVQSKISGNKQVKYKGILNNNPPYADLDPDAYMILPKDADLSTVQSKVTSKDEGGKDIATLSFSYGEHVVGTVGIYATDGKVTGNLLDGSVSKKAKETEDKKKIILKPFYFIIAVSAIAAIIVLIFVIRKLISLKHSQRYSRQMRKMERERFKKIKTKKRHRRKDSIFR